VYKRQIFDWELMRSGAGDGRAPQERAHDGEYIMNFIADGRFDFVSQTIPMDTCIGQPLTVSLYFAGVRIARGGEIGVTIDYLQDGEVTGTQVCSFDRRDSFQWQPFSCALDTSATYDSIEVTIGWRGAAEGVLAVDSVKLIGPGQ
ncbi:MAG: hypothetical protein GYB64_20440, partial [Chloroflexi bacterium]|nr:hypothetical protein [Chloroflexota bacterium]